MDPYDIDSDKVVLTDVISHVKTMLSQEFALEAESLQRHAEALQLTENELQECLENVHSTYRRTLKRSLDSGLFQSILSKFYLVDSFDKNTMEKRPNENSFDICRDEFGDDFRLMTELQKTVSELEDKASLLEKYRIDAEILRDLTQQISVDKLVASSSIPNSAQYQQGIASTSQLLHEMENDPSMTERISTSTQRDGFDYSASENRKRARDEENAKEQTKHVKESK